MDVEELGTREEYLRRGRYVVSLSKIMLYLQYNYTVGIAVSLSAVLISYIVISILIVRYSRRQGVNIAVLGMIPIVQLICLLKGIIYKRRRIKSEKVFDADEQIDLSF